jgi:hypothetical protein
LHNANNRTFYELCILKAEQNQLKQQLGNKQLRLEHLTNPIVISQHLDD